MDLDINCTVRATLRLQVQQASKQLLAILTEQETTLTRWQQDLKNFYSTCLLMDNILPRILGVASLELNSSHATSSDLDEKGIFAFRSNRDIMNLAARAFEQLENISQNLSALAHRMDESCQQLEELKNKGSRVCSDLSADALRAPLVTQTQYIRTGFSAGMQPKATSGLQFAIKDTPSLSRGAATNFDQDHHVPVAVYPSLSECMGYLDLIMRAATDATAGLLSLADELRFRVTGLYLHSTANEKNNLDSQLFGSDKAGNEGLVSVSVTNSTLDISSFPLFRPITALTTPECTPLDHLSVGELPKYLKASPFIRSSLEVKNGAGPAEGNDFIRLSLSELMVSTVDHATRVWSMVQRGKGGHSARQIFEHKQSSSSSSSVDQSRDSQSTKAAEGAPDDEGSTDDLVQTTNDTGSDGLTEATSQEEYQQSHDESFGGSNTSSRIESSAFDALMDAELELLPRAGSLAAEVMTGAPLATWSAVFTALSRCKRQGLNASTEPHSSTPLASKLRRQGTK